MYWAIALSWGIGGTVVFWCVLSSKWNRIDPIFRQVLQTSRIFHPVPGYPGYLDLKFSVLRHSVIFLISSVVIYFIKINFISTIILFLNAIYCLFPICRYRFRKKDVAEAYARPNGQATAEIISIPVKDSFCTVAHAILSAALIGVLYIICP